MAETVESPVPGNRHAGSAGGLGKRTRSNPGTAPQTDSATARSAPIGRAGGGDAAF